MAHWNFRLIDLSDENMGEPWLELCEVHYNDAGVPVGYTSPCVGSETVNGMHELLALHKLALNKPVLTKADFIGEFEEDENEDAQA